MARSYRHVSEYEEEIFALRKKAIRTEQLEKPWDLMKSK